MHPQHDGGVGAGIEDAADLPLGEGDVECVVRCEEPFEPQIRLEKAAAVFREEPKVALRDLLPREPPAGAVGEGVDHRRRGLAVEQQDGAPVAALDGGMEGRAG